MKPTVVVDVPADARIQREEVFGPVVTVTPFDTEDEAIGAANDTPLRAQRHDLHREPVPGAPRVGQAARGHGLDRTASSSVTCAHPSAASATRASGREGGNFSREFFTEPKAVVMALRTS